MPPCKGTGHAQCSPPHCRWASGSKRSFCRSRRNKRNPRNPRSGQRKPPISGCGRTPQAACRAPCKWASGAKRSFCRAARNRKGGRGPHPKSIGRARKSAPKARLAIKSAPKASAPLFQMEPIDDGFM